MSGLQPAFPIFVDDVAEAVASYNAGAERCGWPKVQKMNPARRVALAVRLRECGGIDGWRHAIERAEASDFLCARTSRPWPGFSFDWLISASNFTKIMEGNYDNRPGIPAGNSRPRTLSAILDAAGRTVRTADPDWR